MRFIRLLLVALATTATLTTTVRADFPCDVAPGTCTDCLGFTNCCADTTNAAFGRCNPADNTALDCPTGAAFTCSGTACTSLGLSCSYASGSCNPASEECYGTIVCAGGTCPDGYAQGDFCQESMTTAFNACGSTAPPPTDPPVTEAPTTATPTTAAPTTAAPTTEAPTTAAPTTEAPTEAPTTAAPTTAAPTTEAPTTEAPTTAAPTTEAPTTVAPTTQAPATDAPTTAAPTTSAPSAGTQAPTAAPGDEGTVCYQTIVGGSSYAEIDAAFKLWADKAYAALGLVGERDVSINWAQVPDRDSFENGCDGPYTAVADLFVHINTADLAGDYLSVSAALEAFIAANPITQYSAITCAARSVTDFIPICGIPPKPVTPSGPDGTVCYQEIVGSLSGTYAQINAAFQDWAQRAYVALGLTGELDVSINWAQVPDRDSFENGCNGPYDTVADLFVHIDVAKVTAAGSTYASVKAALEAFITANPLTAYSAISCSARSVTDFIPICGLNPAMPTEAPTTQAPTTAAPTTEAPTTAAPTTEAPTTAAPTTAAPTTAAPTTEAPTTAAPTTEAPTTAAPTTEAPTTAAPSTEAPTTAAPTTVAPATEAPTTAAPTTAAPTTAAPEVPTPANVVCYQEVVGSLQGSYALLSADLDAWQIKLYAALGLTGPLELQMGHAQIPDRVSFENGCDGPYESMADLFVHIQTTAAEYDAVSAKLEAFIAANPLTTYSSIDCMARSVVTFLPTCGKLPTGPSDEQSVLCFQEVVGSMSGDYSAVSAQLDAWEAKLYAELGLSGPLNLNMGHAQIPDRVSFENGCDGPYKTMADLFVYIPTTQSQYDALSARLEAFIAANPFNTGVVSCSARSIVDELPYCGKIMNPGTPAPPTGGAGQQPGAQTCPVVVFTPTASATDISVAVTTPGVTISFMDVHITTATGFYNYRMAASSATAFSLTFPSYLTIGAGESFSYWFTTASTSASFPNLFACDSASFSYTAAGTPTAAPVVTAPACPSIAFDYAIERTGAGSAANLGLYAITFASATPASTVDWVDVHISANGGQFNYRMSAAGTGFVQALPSPHLELATGSTVSYSFTYQANGAACDTASYDVTV